jgi:uncharacterized protein DUF6950
MLSSSCLSLERLPGWEDRLAFAISWARSRPYKLGSHDCFRFSLMCVQALTGEDLWTPWAGTYASKREALRRIAEFAGDFTAAASKFFGSEPQPMALAQRGDICEYVSGAEGKDRDQHLGVVMGVKVALLGPEGLTFVDREDCRHCWFVGHA